MAKYARIFMTGFRSAPVDPEVLRELNNKKVSFKSFPLNKIKMRNITLFSDYDINIDQPQNTILSGISSVYDSTYSGDLYAKITGIGEFFDIGETNISGVFTAQGFHTGIFSGGQTFYDSKNRQVYPVNQNINIASSDNVKYIASGKITGEDLNPKDFVLVSTTGVINSPIINRTNTYSGIYSGVTTLQDNFYDLNSFTVSFYKDYSYVTTGNNNWITNFDVVNPVASSPTETPGIFILNKVMNEGNGFASSTQTIIASGNIPNVKLPRKNLTGYSELTGKLTGQVLQIDSGVYIFSKVVTGNVLSARQGFGTGFINSFNFLNLNTPDEFDFITIDDPNKDILSTFTYATGALFNPPLYFNSLSTLNNIINSGTGSYGISSQIIGGKLKITSATSGESGNLISIQSFGSPTRPFFDVADFLQSGVTYYEPLVPTGIFRGRIYSVVLATGLMTTGYSDFVTGNLTGTLGLKRFQDVWNLYASDDNVSYLFANTFTGLTSTTGVRYRTDFIDDPVVNIYNIQVQYINPDDRVFDDVAQLKIKLNDAETVNITLTGVQ
jgi:hypothetical protein